MKHAVSSCIAFAVTVAVGFSAASAEPPVRDVSSLAIAVAPFEREAPPGAVVPDIETLLADRIGTQGVSRIVGPGEFAVEADAEPAPETVQTWAKQKGVKVVVVGRTTRIGNQVSVDVRLRSGETGVVVGTYVAEVLHAERLEPAVDRLANQILDGAGDFLHSSVSAEPPPSPTPPAPRKSDDRPFGISFDSDQPVSIRSDELEAVEVDGTRRLLFTENVVVTQDDVTIRSNRLEAFYPAETSQPDRLLASGRVRMKQGDREARCDEATYDRAKEMLVCRGNAELREGEDCVTGQWIEFDTAAETVKVKGGAKVVIGGCP
jgi:lipopolysaccharide transport protein LptA